MQHIKVKGQNLDVARINRLVVIPGRYQMFIMEYDDPQYHHIPIEVGPGDSAHEEIKSLYAARGGETAPLSKNLKRHLISFKEGVALVRLSESIDTNNLRIRSTVACIDRRGSKIKIGDSDLATSSLTLTCDESLLLAEAIMAVNAFWNNNRLPIEHVLLNCGHIVYWNEFVDGVPLYRSQLPEEGQIAYCQKCYDDYKVVRFHPEDFIDDPGQEE